MFQSHALICDNLKTTNEQKASKIIALSILEHLSEDIAELIVTQKQHSLNAEQKTQQYVNIITHMAEVVALIVVKVQEKRMNKNISVKTDSKEQEEEIIKQIALYLADISAEIN